MIIPAYPSKEWFIWKIARDREYADVKARGELDALESRIRRHPYDECEHFIEADIAILRALQARRWVAAVEKALAKMGGFLYR